MERKQLSKGHSPTEDGRGRDKSGHGKKATKQGELTNWRQQREGQVRTWKESNQARGTHSLETAEGGTSQDMERKQPSKGHSLPETAEGGTSQDMERKQPSKGHSHPGDSRGRDKSGHGKKVTKQGALTSLR